MDVDECVENNHTCHRHALCVDTVFLYECVCPPGYSGNGTYCKDIDECLDNSDVCHEDAHCYNTAGSYNCACRDGYGGDGFNCTDIDQCQEGSHHCHPNATCVNTFGMDGYNCSCDPGFTGDGFVCEDINECSDPGLHNCTQNATCMNTEGGYKCVCNEGFTAQGSICIDIDDCDGVNCFNGGTCVDAIGSFFCNCSDGTSGDVCNIYESTWSSWSSWSDDCFCRESNGTAMVSRVRSRSCPGKPGYSGTPTCDGDDTDWEECIPDVDECEEGTSHCHPNATCKNVIGVGQYNCTCDSGFAGDGFRCKDIDECKEASLHNCSQNQTCANTQGSYVCVCKEGFHDVSTDEEKLVCIDIDDCDGVNCFNGGTCVDAIGSFFCNCSDGTSGDVCNIYESTWSSWSSWSDDCFCRVSNGTAMVSRVRSRPCPGRPGYSGTPTCDGDDTDWEECIPDVDECEEGTSHCHPNATCKNVVGVGQYNCTCDSGFAGDGFRCKDIDECKEASLHNCSQNQTCTNTQGSYVCVCKEGFYDVSFDGKEPVCIDVDDCRHVTCWNSGVCLDGLGNYTCDCLETFTGEHCEYYQSTWGEWSPWTEDCEAQYVNHTAVEARIRTRRCLDRIAYDGAPLCEGTDLEWQLCNIGREARNFSGLFQTVKSSIQPGYTVGDEVLDLKELSLDDNDESADYEILCCDEGKFVLEENGLLRVSQMLDPNRPYELTIVAIDDTAEPSALLHIFEVMIDVNHTEWIYDRTGCPHVVLTREVEEGQSNGTVIVDLATELGEDETSRYFLQFGLCSDLVNVNEFTGIVSTSKTLDRETMPSLNFDVVVVNHTSTTTVTVNVNVTDINDHQPIFHNTPVAGIISSDAPAGTIVAIVKATDEDEGTNGMVEYVLESYKDAFKISSTEGVIRVKDTKSLPNSNDLQVITLSVSARDNGTVPRSTPEPRAVELTIVSSSVSEIYVVETVEENIPVDTVVANFSDKLQTENTEDPPGKYRFILQDDGSGQAQMFSLDNTTGILTTAADIDRESPIFQGRFTFTVLAKKEGSCDSKLISVTIDVTDTNDNTPVFSAQSYVGHIAENATADDFVIFRNQGPEATDADFGCNGTVTYGIHSSQDGGMFAINPQTAEIYVSSGSEFDRESKDQYSFTITATDRDGGIGSFTGTASITIIIDDINDNAPIIHSTQNHIDLYENVTRGHLITTLSATDADEGANAEIVYSLEDGDGFFLFNIHPTTGELKVTSGHLDRETTETYELTISARDRGSPSQTVTQSMTITILDCNDNAPIFSQNVYKFSVREDVGVGTTIAAISATDADVTIQNSDVRYTIVNGRGTFYVDSTTGAVVVNDTLDYEEGQTYFEFEVEAEDTGNPVLTGKRSILQINVLDANDNRPIISVNQNYSLLTTAPKGSIVTVVQASDLDSGDNGKVTFAIDPPQDSFIIDEETGIVKLNQLENTNEITSVITATDNGEEKLSSSLTLVVQVIEPDPGDTLDPLNFNNDTYKIDVPENIPGNSPVLNVSIAEAGLTYEILPESPLFQVDTQGIIHTRERQHPNDESSLLDRETSEQHVLVIVAKGTYGRQAIASVLINVLDVNDEPPVFPEGEEIFEVTEGDDWVDRTAGNVAASDRDAGLNGTVEYRIIGGNIDDSFDISTISGSISVKRPLDRESLNNDEIILTVQATDKGDPPLSSTKDVRIKVKDINDEPPVFTEDTYFGSIDEEQEGGILVLQVSATDKDLGSNADVKYRIISGDGGFHVVAGGSIFSSKKLDRETKAIYSFVVEAYNPGADWLNETATVNITVNGINDNPPNFTTQQPETITIPEDTNTGTSVFRVSAEDRDYNDVNYRLTGGSCRELFSIEESTGEISVKERLDTIDRRDEVYSCIIEVTAEDDGVPSLNATKRIAVNITAVNYFWPEFEATFLNMTVREGLRWGDPVDGVLLNATDADEGRNGVVMLEITDSSIKGLFNVTAEGQLILNVAELDREPDNDHVSVNVSAYDLGTPRKYANVSAVVHITVLDINDNVPVPDNESIKVSIPQDTPLQTVVLNVTASDRDIGENAIMRFCLDERDREGIASLFLVDSTTGAITVNGALDLTSYVFYVNVENTAGFEGNVNEFEKYNIKVNVTVISTNRHTPIFTKGLYSVNNLDALSFYCHTEKETGR
ncbi:protocadherin Fat 4-like [Branchiostoma floridae]|uniref:Protocadherin Fat 4-like n=1 Tax=Branchiostoma floridae TaxID=7739 RepID=A0A9J7HPZ2_BRAFL|nr:protocadherin Fat 4-like [Branchiostoma floridae]